MAELEISLNVCIYTADDSISGLEQGYLHTCMHTGFVVLCLRFSENNRTLVVRVVPSCDASTCTHMA